MQSNCAAPVSYRENLGQIKSVSRWLAAGNAHTFFFCLSFLWLDVPKIPLLVVALNILMQEELTSG